MALKLECGYLKGFIGEHEYAAMASQVENAHALLASGKGPGNDFLGWVDLPTNYDKEEFARIKAAAERIKKNTDVFIVIRRTLLLRRYHARQRRPASVPHRLLTVLSEKKVCMLVKIYLWMIFAVILLLRQTRRLSVDRKHPP